MQPSEKINVLVATDDKYSPFCGVMLTSLLENNSKEDITVHLMTSGLNPDTVRFLKNIVEYKYNQHLNIYIIDESILNDCPIRKGDHITIATYYRVICANIIPSDVDKILYLDCDIIVRDSIREFWDLDIEDYALAATIDPAWTQGQKYERLGLNPNDKYFCSGVMLINLKYWRSIDATKQCFDVLSHMKDNLLQHDQDILNIVFNKKWMSVSYRWDYCYGQECYFNENEFLKDLNKESKYYPVIVHFTGPKPWKSKGGSLFQHEFDKYFQMALNRRNKIEFGFSQRLLYSIRKIFGKTDWRNKYY